MLSHGALFGLSKPNPSATSSALTHPTILRTACYESVIISMVSPFTFDLFSNHFSSTPKIPIHKSSNPNLRFCNGKCSKKVHECCWKFLVTHAVELSKNLHDDSFEGSLNEDTIFKDVFFGHENGGSSKRCVVTGAIRFENDDNTPKNSSFPSTDDHSVTTSHEDSGTLSEELISCKRRKVSILEHSIATCRLVESSVHGVKSSCYLLKRHVADQYPNDSSSSQESIQEPVKYFKKIPKDSSFLDLDENENENENEIEDEDGKILAFCKSDNTSCQTNNVDEDSTIDDQESCRKLSISSLEDQNDSKFKRQKGKKGKPATKKRKTHVGNVLKQYNNRKGSCRLLPRGHHHFKENFSAIGVRTVLSWLIDSGVIHQNEVITYKNPRDNSVIKDGLITRDGIICRCCDNVFSVSKFKIHSGFTLNCPCLNLFMESGKSLTLCQLEAWSNEYKVKKAATQTVIQEFDQNDDSCGLCGDGGDLICCDNCPSTFHQECLRMQELPEDHKECVMKTGIGNGLVSLTWFCSESCKEIHSGLDSQVGMMNSVSDGFSWTLLRCTHVDGNVLSDHHFVALKVERNLKLAVALTIMEECFLPMIDPRTGINMIPHVLYNQGSEFTRLDYEGFYTVVLEKDDMLLSIACIRRLMNAVEKLLKSLKIEKLVLCAIPSLVDTWIQNFGFMHLEDEEKKYLRKTNLMVFPGTVWLKKPMHQGAIHKTPRETMASYWDFGLEEDMTMPVNGKQLLQKDRDYDDDLKVQSEEQHSAFEGMCCEVVCGVK
ncbi:hypothetical protein L2E82_37488 [Cichorium intybus]|uniref:Uncharacterized protein n=1 Tax=Cichorium intybus TaxID=13427 RepID=A0ACB9AEC8_CICIN|nr:hypothetical protein L2E82_37488 [Cichorium intybus]